MTAALLVRDMFMLSTGTTVLACEGDDIGGSFSGRLGTLVVGNEIRQTVTLIGEREMLKQSLPRSYKAIETRDSVNLSIEEARSGFCRLLVEDQT